MDPLSDVLSLLKPQSLVSGGFEVSEEVAVRWPKHAGIKCYALLAGQCWLSVEGVPDPVLISGGDCFLLPRGLPFSLATDPSLPPVDFSVFRAARGNGSIAPQQNGRGNYIAGGHFVLTGSHADVLLKSLPPVVHIRKESDKVAMRWSLERLKEELRDPQPGGSLIAQQLAYMMLVQALRLHLADTAKGGVGWLFALSDPQMSAALGCMHEEPGSPWTLQTLAARMWHVAVCFRIALQGNRGHDSDGISDRLAHDAGRREAEEQQRLSVCDCPLARLRIRERLRQGVSQGYGLLAAEVWPSDRSG